MCGITNELFDCMKRRICIGTFMRMIELNSQEDCIFPFNLFFLSHILQQKKSSPSF